jgi:hypothetical protein
VSKLEKVIEQTTFLLEKQRQAHQECQTVFEDLLAYVTKKIDAAHDEEEVETLENIHDILAGQAEQLTEDAGGDISFLTEHIKALKKIREVKDAAKATELLNALIDEQEEILETTDFKDEITRESEVAKDQLLAMVADLKDALEEGNSKEVELYLESLFQGEEDADGCEDDEDGEHDEDEEDGCGSCSGGCETGGGCGTGKCCSSDDDEEGDDIFSFLNKKDDKDH